MINEFSRGVHSLRVAAIRRLGKCNEADDGSNVVLINDYINKHRCTELLKSSLKATPLNPLFLIGSVNQCCISNIKKRRILRSNAVKVGNFFLF